MSRLLTLQAKKICSEKKGFVLLPRRWVVERSFGWAARFRRWARDYERLASTLVGYHWLAFVLLMLKNFFAKSACQALGDGIRIGGGWQVTNVSLPPDATIRARGYLTSGNGNGSCYFVESVWPKAVPIIHSEGGQLGFQSNAFKLNVSWKRRIACRGRTFSRFRKLDRDGHEHDAIRSDAN